MHNMFGHFPPDTKRSIENIYIIDRNMFWMYQINREIFFSCQSRCVIVDFFGPTDKTHQREQISFPVNYRGHLVGT